MSFNMSYIIASSIISKSREDFNTKEKTSCIH
nr:MAG TPA: hypothetical protein [Caudoviricetes sp.]